MNVRRILGLIIMLTALLGVAISIGGIVVSRDALDRVGDELDQGFTTSSDTLSNLDQTLALTNDVLVQVIASMSTLEQASQNAAKALEDTRPLVRNVGQITTGDVADAIDSLQEAVDPLVGLTATIDQVLKTLAEFQIEQTILGFPIAFDLGIVYDPEVSLPDTVQAIGDSIAGVPESLRVLSNDVDVVDENLGVIGSDLALMSGDISDMQTSLNELPPLIEGFSDNVDSAQRQIQTMQSKLNDIWRLLKAAVVIFFVWLGLTQIAPFLRGYEMVTGRRIGEREA